MARVYDAKSLYDFIGYVVLCAPNQFPIRDYLPDEEQMDLEKAFLELQRGAILLASTTDNELELNQLTEILGLSLKAYRSGDQLKGAHLLQDLEGILFKK